MQNEPGLITVMDSHYEAEWSNGLCFAFTPAAVPGTLIRRPSAYEDWTVEELRQKAERRGVQGAQRMNKLQLIHALRSH